MFYVVGAVAISALVVWAYFTFVRSAVERAAVEAKERQLSSELADLRQKAAEQFETPLGRVCWVVAKDPLDPRAITPSTQSEGIVLVMTTALAAAFEVALSARGEQNAAEVLASVSDDVLLFEAAAFAYTSVCMGVSNKTRGRARDTLAEAAIRLGSAMAEKTSFEDPLNVLVSRSAVYRTNLDDNYGQLAAILLRARGSAQPAVTTGPEEIGNRKDVRVLQEALQQSHAATFLLKLLVGRLDELAAAA